MDGEEKLWNMGEELKTNSPLIEILDIIHASSYIWKAIQALHPKNTITENIPLVKEQVGRLLEGGAQRVIRSLRWQATHMKLKGTELENLNT